MELSPDICADFLVEAREIVDQLGEQMAVLERAPDDRDCLNAVFRGFHTIKGGAGFLDLAPVVAICHAVEDRLNLARGGERALDPATFDRTMQALDLLVDMLDAVAGGQPPQPAPPALLDGFRAASAAPAPAIDLAVVDLDDLDFDALLDSLHGTGAIPGAAPAAPPAPAPAPAPLPAAPAGPRPAAAAHHEDPTVRVDVRRLDAMVNLVGELVLARNRLKTIRPRLRDEALDRAVATLDSATSRLQSAVMMARMQPVGRVFARFPKLARDVARQLHKSVELEVVGGDTELDRNLVEALADPLVHLVRNAIDHGVEAPDARRRAGKPEKGRVLLSAQQEGDHVAIEVRDDGAGIDPERIRDSAVRKGLIDRDAQLSPDECLQLLFLPGFSTRAEVSDVSGRGVGMDVVQSKIRELSGQVQIQSEPGKGSRFIIRVPLTLAILPTLLVEVGGDVYALPLVRVVEVLASAPAAPMSVDGREVIDLRQQPLPLLGLREWLGPAAPAAPATDSAVVVLHSGEQRFCLAVDRVRGREEVVIKALPGMLRGLAGYAGASLIGDGRMAMILDVDALHRTGVRKARADVARLK